jgi:hypothetical protein
MRCSASDKSATGSGGVQRGEEQQAGAQRRDRPQVVADIATQAEQGVDAFLRLYAADSPTSSLGENEKGA